MAATMFSFDRNSIWNPFYSLAIGIDRQPEEMPLDLSSNSASSEIDPAPNSSDDRVKQEDMEEYSVSPNRSQLTSDIQFLPPLVVDPYTLPAVTFDMETFLRTYHYIASCGTPAGEGNAIGNSSLLAAGDSFSDSRVMLSGDGKNSCPPSGWHAEATRPRTTVKRRPRRKAPTAGGGVGEKRTGTSVCRCRFCYEDHIIRQRLKAKAEGRLQH